MKHVILKNFKTVKDASNVFIYVFIYFVCVKMHLNNFDVYILMTIHNGLPSIYIYIYIYIVYKYIERDREIYILYINIERSDRKKDR